MVLAWKLVVLDQNLWFLVGSSFFLRKPVVLVEGLCVGWKPVLLVGTGGLAREPTFLGWNLWVWFRWWWERRLSGRRRGLLQD